jgi:hypothetical protein
MDGKAIISGIVGIIISLILYIIFAIVYFIILAFVIKYGVGFVTDDTISGNAIALAAAVLTAGTMVAGNKLSE